MPQPPVDFGFESKMLDPRLRWHCQPARCEIDPAGRCLRIWPDAATDFWQTTHYGFNVDNGHFLGAEVRGDFVLGARIRFSPVHQYDQAGLMVRLSQACWLKTSVEHEPEGPSRLGAVVTNFSYSDWSTQPFPRGAGEIWLRVRREADDFIVDVSRDGGAWEQIRMAHLHEARGRNVNCGVYACSPKGGGFVTEFASVTLAAGRIS